MTHASIIKVIFRPNILDALKIEKVETKYERNNRFNTAWPANN